MAKRSNVLNFQGAKPDVESSNIKSWHKRHAMQLAVQLPDDEEDVRLVLKCLEELTDTYLYAPDKSEEGAV